MLKEPQRTEEDGARGRAPARCLEEIQHPVEQSGQSLRSTGLRAPWPPPAPPPSRCSLEVSLLPLRVVNKVGQTVYS